METNNKQPWSDEDISYLIDNWNKLKPQYLAKNLNRTEAAIKKKAYKLKLRKPYKREVGEKWKDEDIDFLIKNWNKVSLDVLVNGLNRSEAAILTILAIHPPSSIGGG